MRNANQLAVMTAITLTFALGGSLAAQAQASANRTANQDLRNLDWRNMDPQEIQKLIQQRLMETIRERLEVTDDAEWKIIEERLSKVTQARMATLADGGGFAGIGGPGFGGGGPGGGRGLQGLFGQPSPEAQALQQAIDSKASATELKARLAKLEAARKQKQANLVKAQNELRLVLTPRQEAVVALMGLMD